MNNDKVNLLNESAINAAQAYGSDWTNLPYRCPKCYTVMTFSYNHLRHCNGPRGGLAAPTGH